jgi:hypothetical protein
MVVITHGNPQMRESLFQKELQGLKEETANEKAARQEAQASQKSLESANSILTSTGVQINNNLNVAMSKILLLESDLEEKSKRLEEVEAKMEVSLERICL